VRSRAYLPRGYSTAPTASHPAGVGRGTAQHVANMAQWCTQPVRLCGAGASTEPVRSRQVTLIPVFSRRDSPHPTDSEWVPTRQRRRTGCDRCVPGDACALALLVLLVGVAGVRQEGPAAFTLGREAPVFTAPAAAWPVFFVLCLLAFAGDWVGSVARSVCTDDWLWVEVGVAGLQVVAVLPFVTQAWRGSDISLRADGFYDGRNFGTLVVSWEAIPMVRTGRSTARPTARGLSSGRVRGPGHRSGGQPAGRGTAGLRARGPCSPPRLGLEHLASPYRPSRRPVPRRRRRLLRLAPRTPGRYRHRPGLRAPSTGTG
jgi:hypothetical protein